jgi:Fe-S cluster biogenesis protein NfuA/nitrite reductase/ring-hydroxylating ferredoxin subunit
MADGQDVREAGARVEALLEELASAPGIGPKAQELVALLVELYGSALRRIVEICSARADAEELLGELAADPLVASLLVVHDLHPVPTVERVQAALDHIRPYLGSHAGGVELLGVEPDGVVRLRLAGSCHGCPSSTLTVKLAIERAILEAAPEVTRVEVEGVSEPPRPGLLQIQPLRPSDGGWRRLEGVGPLLPGSVFAVDVDGLPIVLASAAGTLYAYRNACGACGGPLGEARLDGTVLTCPACGRAFDVRLAGRALEGDASLDPLPLLPEEGGWKVALPQGVAR